MRGVSIRQLQQNRVQVVLVLVVLAALLIPQVAWAADMPAAASFTCSGLGFSSVSAFGGNEEACSHYLGLLERYRSGDLEFHAPRQSRSAQLEYHAPGR